MSNDQGFDARLRHFIDTKTKPVGSLGRIEELAEQYARLKGELAPSLSQLGLTVFAADHGIAEEGVSAYPQSVTSQMVQNFVFGGAAANAFSNTVGAYLQVVDSGIKSPVTHPNLIQKSMGPGTRNSAREPAMTPSVRDDAWSIGQDMGETAHFDAVAYGEMGIGNTSTAALLAHKIIGAPIDELVGRGTGLDDTALESKKKILAAAAERTGALNARQAMVEYGGFEIVMMAGAMTGAARNRKLVIVDGFIATTAALIVLELEPDLRPAFVFAHHSQEPGHRIILEHLDAKPLLDLGLRLGEGTGALLAWPLVKAAVAMLTDMASFESAGVSGKEG